MMRRMFLWAVALVMVLSAMPAANAAVGTVTYSGDSGKFIFAPGSSHSPTDLFPYLKDVMPGDTITQYISVKNNASNRVKVKLYIRALGAHKDSEEFLSQLQLTVTNSTGTVMFDAPASSTKGLTDWTYLGTLYSGGKADLAVVLKVPVELDNRFQDAVGYLDWSFYAEELPVSPSDPPAQTGDRILPYIITFALSGAAIAVLLILEKKKRIRAQH